MNSFLLILYVLGLYFAFAAGSMVIRNSAAFSQPPTRKSNFPATTLFLLVAIGIPSILQFFFPALLTTLQRDYERFLNGDWWRLISPLFVQDGGIIGIIFNLMSLALVGSVAERIWSGRWMLLIFLVGGIFGEIVGFAWQPIGAGNSVGNFSLAASIAVASLMRSSLKSVQLFAIMALGADGILVRLQDIHGAAAIMGAVQALLLGWFWHESTKT